MGLVGLALDFANAPRPLNRRNLIHSQPMTIITETAELLGFCESLADAPYVALDTEFMRESTYWPELCLIQASDGAQTIAIDPLAKNLDLSPFYEVLDRPTIVKVFHAGRQDLEIFHHRTGRLPHPVFDTQIAAMVCGFGDAASYQLLAKRILGVDLDKSQRYSDWQRRPLLKEQIVYALSDAAHLCGIYLWLKAKIAEWDRESWIADPMAALVDPALYEMSPETAWRRLRFTVSGRRKLGVLAAAAAWREEEAQRLNIPRGRVMRDDALREVAQRAPKDREALERMRGVSKGFVRSRMAERLLARVAGAGEMKPEKDRRKVSAPPELLDMLRLLLRFQCARHSVAPKLVASNGSLEQIAAGMTEGVEALEGWRREVFGREALALMRGETCLAVEKGAVSVVERPAP